MRGSSGGADGTALRWPQLAALALCSATAALTAQAPSWMKEREWCGGMLSPMAYDAGRGRIVMFGARSGETQLEPWGSYSDETWEWDGTRWIERSPAHRPPPLSGVGLAYDMARRRIVLFGGAVEVPGGMTTVNDTWTWDGVDWTRQDPATSPPVRWAHSMAYDALRQQVVLFGGSTGSDFRDDTWTWDGVDWTRQNPATTVPPAHALSGMVYDEARQQVVMVGGWAAGGPMADVWAWTGTDWTSMPSLPQARDLLGIAYDSVRQRIVLFGGEGPGVSFGDTLEWDGTAWLTLSPATRPSPRQYHPMAYDAAHGTVVMTGGSASRSGQNWSSFPRETWSWDGTDWRILANADTPPARSMLAMANDARQQSIVVFGGIGPEGLLGDTWIRDGFAWSRPQPVTSPPARQYHAMAAEPGSGGVLVFGGFGAAGLLGDTWIWSAGSWTQAAPGTSPPARYMHAMAFDPARGQLVLFGGIGARYLSDTWVWDGASWRDLTGPGPSARRLHAMAYDPTSGSVILHGGYATTGILGDTWSWNGTSWTLVASTGPRPRHAHAMAADASRGRVVLFGGMTDTSGTSTSYPTDAWEWDGTAWSPTTAPSIMLRRAYHAMAYDGPRQRLLMFGGRTGWTEYLGDTWYFGTMSPARTVPYGTGCSGVGGVPLIGSGVSYLGNESFTLDLVAANPDAVCLFGIDFMKYSRPLMGGCTVYLGTIPILLPAVANPGCYATVRFRVPREPAMIGGSVFAQGFVVDPTFGLALTAGLQIVVGD
ncbi:MAG: hypothetical protein IPM29_03165 [Planctomycetes bacterium]|nr:hypothetical protein [Planctomycetota bacterium]